MSQTDTKFEDGDITGAIIGCAMRVHSALGNGFQEVIYQRALAIELAKAKIAYQREFEMPVYYDGQEIGIRRVDFFIDAKISVELKAIIALEPVHLAQAKNYLEAYNLKIGLLLNFGSKSLEIRRLINPKHKAVSPSIKSQ
jgi:GxxExxY protein